MMCRHCGFAEKNCKCIQFKLRDDVDGLEIAIMRMTIEIRELKEKIEKLENKSNA